MNGSPATKRPRDLSNSSYRSHKRQRSEHPDNSSGLTFFQNFKHRFMSSWWSTPIGSPRVDNVAQSSPRRPQLSERRAVTNSQDVIEFVDTDDDTGLEEAAEKRRRRELQHNARLHLNDHVPKTAERNVHPLLDDGPLFTSRFGEAPSSSQMAEAASSSRLPANIMASTSATSPVSDDHLPRRDTDRPVRTYTWQRSAPSNSSGSDRSVHAHKQGIKRNKNLRSAKDNSQRLMLEEHIQRMRASGQGGLETMERVKVALETNPQPKKKIHRARSNGRLGPSEFLGSFTTDMRKTLDQASTQPQAEYKLVRPVQKRPTLPRIEGLDSPLYSKLQIDKSIEDQKIKLRLARTPPPIPTELQPQQNIIADATLRDSSFKANIGKDSISATSIRRLAPGKWLNDEVVNCYAELINLRSQKTSQKIGRSIYCWNSFFYQRLSEQGYAGAKLKRWTKKLKLDIFALDKMLLPINHGNSHWVCAVVDFRRQRIEYYDSLPDGGRRNLVFQHIRSYLTAEHQEKKGIALDLSAWEDIHNPHTPRQDNQNDCGVFACQTLETVARGRDLVKNKFEFNHVNMPFFRRLMIVEMASGELAQRSWAKL